MKKYLYTIDIKAQDAPAKLLRAVGKNKRVLELGCASGVQTKILKEEFGCTVTGVEIDPFAAADAAKYCERVVIGDLESMDFRLELGETCFDVITIADVLEHLRDPLDVLVKLRPHLRADGYVVASIPNVVHAALILEMAHGRFDYRPYGLLDDTHIRFFTLKTIYRLFEDSGFVIHDIDRVVRPVEEAEMSNHQLSPEESLLLQFISRNNSEAQTYQFIVSATTRDADTTLKTYGQLEALDRLKDAKLTNTALSRRVRTLEDQIVWMESHPIYRILFNLKRLVSRRNEIDKSSLV